MMPRITGTAFGWIEVAGRRYAHDIVIGVDGEVRKRKKKLSKKVYGTSHRLSLQEAEHIYDAAAERLLVGGGQFGRVVLSDEAAAFCARHGLDVEVLPTPQAVARWNDLLTTSDTKIVALFHVTC